MGQFVKLTLDNKEKDEIYINMDSVNCMYETKNGTVLNSGINTFKVIETLDEINTKTIIGI